MQIYERIRDYIREHKITQHELAEACGYADPTVSLMLQGRRGIYAEDLVAICRYLNVPATTFIPYEEGGFCHVTHNERNQ